MRLDKYLCDMTSYTRKSIKDIQTVDDDEYISNLNMIKNKKGFTLVEILAVIVLISLIIIIAVPSVKSISYKSKKTF